MPLKKQARHQLASRLAVTALCGLLALSFPLIVLPSQPWMLAGIPLLYCYIFFVWLVLIIITRRTIGAIRRTSESE